MSAAVISIGDAVRRSAASMKLPPQFATYPVCSEFVAEALRRALHILAPCAAHELAGSVAQSLAAFGLMAPPLRDLVENTLEELIVYGDALELRDAEDAYWERGGLLLRPAPPSFVCRSDGSAVILGIAGEEATALTGEIAGRVQHCGAVRLLPAAPGEDLRPTLRESGLVELSERTWLRMPRDETAGSHLTEWRKQLDNEPTVSGLDELRVLNTSKSPDFYRDRWSEVGRAHDGLFVGRRPQRYGSPVWCISVVENGIVRRFKDLHVAGDRIRPCDLAWRVQMALDAESGTAQRFGLSEGDSGRARVDFYSPIPSWAERRLAVQGAKTSGRRSLFAYELPAEIVETETSFLQRALWLKETKVTGEA